MRELWCWKCQQMKPETEFHLNRYTRRGRSKSRGRAWECKPCKNPEGARAVRRSRAANPERARASARAYRLANPEKVRASYERACATPKQAAREVLLYAVKSGKIDKPTVCEGCGQSFPIGRIQGHHEDYTKPLAVRWLCHPCHMKLHRKYDKPAPGWLGVRAPADTPKETP